MNHRMEGPGDSRRQYIKFLANDQEFAAAIMSVKEIRGWTNATAIPHVPDYVRGIINLRGSVLPVIDLKARLGSGLTEVAPSNVIIVVDTEQRTIGLLVDAVLDILSVSDENIREVPDAARVESNGYVEGIAVLDNALVTLLDVDKLTSSLGDIH